MKNFIPSLILISLLFPFSLEGQMCLPEGIHFTRQSQIDSFSIQYPGCTEIGGDVCIGICQGEEDSDITNLDGLLPLTSIKGKLNIVGNYLLTSIEGLKNLTVLEDDVKLSENYILPSLKGLDQVQAIKGSLIIEWNTGLDSITGFDLVDSITGTFSMIYLWELTTITAFSNLKYLGGYKAQGLGKLVSIPDMPHLEYLGNFIIEYCGITDLPEFPLVDTIHGSFRLYDNVKLPVIRGYENIVRVDGDLIIAVEAGELIRGVESVTVDAFHQLSYVGGRFNFGVIDLDTLVGFSMLDTVVGEFAVDGSNGFHTFPQNNQFKYIGGNIYLTNLSLLENLDCLNSLEKINGGLNLASCPNLLSLASISHFTEIGGGLGLIRLNLTSLADLVNVTFIDGNLRLYDCNSLTNLSGLEGLDSINGHIFIFRNFNLETLEGIQNIEPGTIREAGNYAVSITENPRLGVCNVESICEALRGLRRSYQIHSNAPGCDHISQIVCKDFGLSGVVYFDGNENKVKDTDEVGIPGIPIRFQPDDLLSITNAQGEFFMFADSGDVFTMTPELSLNWTLTTDSLTYTSAFEEGSVGNDGHLFGLSPIGDWYDLSLGLTSNPIRCNQNVHFFLHWLNGSTSAVDGRITMLYDSLATFVSSTIAPSIHDEETRELTWDIDSLGLYTGENVRITFAMADESFVGHLMNFYANAYIDTSGTEVLMDEEAYTPVLVCAVDPNDKLVMPPGIHSENYTLKDDLLTYTIRFENLGNAEAIDITIMDTLDAALDVSSFEVVNSSFPVLTILDEQVVTFFFKNIWLPAMGTGFVTYEIKANADIQDHTLVENSADIIFDLNQPIFTNTTANTLVYEICDDVHAVFDTTICQGEEFLGYTASGIYFDTLQIGSICDSFAEIRLTVLEKGAIAIDTFICQGESYYGYDTTGVFTFDSINMVTGCTDIVTLHLEVIPLGMGSCITGTIDLEEVKITIFPNPVQEEIYISASAFISSVEFFTTDGLKVLIQKYSDVNTQVILQIGSNIPDGFYLMAIEVEGRVYFEKVVVVR